jgi:hypothetical protein
VLFFLALRPHPRQYQQQSVTAFQHQQSRPDIGAAILFSKAA